MPKTIDIVGGGAASAGAAVTDHGDLTGLADDDHPQYLTAAEGTAAFDAISAAATAASGAASALASHEGDSTNIHGIVDAANLLLKTLADAKGDLLVATAADVFARFGIGADGSGLVADSAAASGLAWRAAGLLASLVAPSSAIANTETVMIAATLPANTLKVGDTFVVKASGVGTTSTSPGSGTWRLRCAPTTLTGSSVTNIAPSFTASRTAKGWAVDFLMTVYTIGAGGTVMGEGSGVAGVTANDLFAAPAVSVSTATLAVDTTVDNLLELSFQSGAASANATAHAGFIRRL